MTNYTVIANNNNNESLHIVDTNSQDVAAKIANDLCYIYKNVYVSFYDKFYKSEGYLNKCGNHEITGKNWVKN